MDIISVDSNIIVENEEEKSISVQNKDIIVSNSEPEFEVTVQRKEYSIVGDGLYIPKRYEDAPQWVRDLIGTVTEESFNQKITELNSLTQTLNQLIVELDIAKNTYTQSIISSNDIDERINTAITTLNSSLAQSDATILGIANTKVTPQESLALTIDTLSASIENGAINALVSNIENASVDRDSALANDISLVHSELSGDIEGNADAITSLNTSVTNINNTLTAQATEITNLTTELDNGTNTWSSADSTLENSLRTEITGEGARVESKFAYNSNVNINGVWKKSGFGLSTNYISGNGTESNPYISEFWINAAKFKFTNDNATGQVAPFTIDATGVTPKVTFNGEVSFTNVTGASDLVSTANIQNVIANNVTTIDGGKIVTNQVFVNNLNAVGGVVADTITGNELNGTVVNGAVINGARINGSVIKASYLDLDGELEVLTNYHITPAMYNANPSLYIDAVYLSGTNEWRIPSINTVREEIKIQNISNSGSIFNSKIRSYNCANASHNIKCVKIRPNITVSSDVDFFDFNFYNQIPAASTGITNTYKLYIASVLVCSIFFLAERLTPENTGFYINGTKRDFSDDIIFNTAGQVIKLSFYNFNTFYNTSEIVSKYNYGIKATIVAGTNTIPLDYNDTSKGLIYIENIGGSTLPSVNNYVQVTSKTNTFISINNMI